MVSLQKLLASTRLNINWQKVINWVNAAT